MKALYIALLASLFLAGCSKEPTLQKYFVEKSESKDFIAVDVSPSIINVDKAKLTAEQKTALESFDKMNILAFKKGPNNQKEFDAESQKITQILKGKEYQELIKYDSGKDAASVSFVGDENHINEFVLYANRKENGFAVVRILGDDMNPNNILNIISILKSSNIDMEQLKPLQGLIK
jgi:phage-related baseplate assembly protein